MKTDEQKSAAAQLKKLDARVKFLQKSVAEQCYADDYETARAVARKFVMEAHLREINDERMELDFLERRRVDLVAEAGGEVADD